MARHAKIVRLAAIGTAGLDRSETTRQDHRRGPSRRALWASVPLPNHIQPWVYILLDDHAIVTFLHPSLSHLSWKQAASSPLTGLPQTAHLAAMAGPVVSPLDRAEELLRGARRLRLPGDQMASHGMARRVARGRMHAAGQPPCPPTGPSKQGHDRCAVRSCMPAIPAQPGRLGGKLRPVSHGRHPQPSPHAPTTKTECRSACSSTLAGRTVTHTPASPSRSPR